MPSVVERAVNAYRDEGVGGLTKRVSQRLRGEVSRGTAYQEKRAVSVEERWASLDRVIPAGSRSLLDIGSNLGDLTVRASRRGMFSIGVETDGRYTKEASEKYGDDLHCGFVTMTLDPDNIGSLPEFDAILLLSVHHNWVDHYGVEAGAEMVREVVRHARDVVIFEGAGRKMRFGANPPDIVDNDEASITAFYDHYLAETLGDLASRIEPLGPTPNHEPEPFRWSWAIYR